MYMSVHEWELTMAYLVLITTRVSRRRANIYETYLVLATKDLYIFIETVWLMQFQLLY